MYSIIGASTLAGGIAEGQPVTLDLGLVSVNDPGNAGVHVLLSQLNDQNVWEELGTQVVHYSGQAQVSGVSKGTGILRAEIMGAQNGKVVLTGLTVKTEDRVQENYVVVECNDDGLGGKDYRFGFNGQMKDNEIAGTGNHNTALFWEYDTRLGRRWNLDPVTKPWESRYATLGNTPIWHNDVLGDYDDKNVLTNPNKDNHEAIVSSENIGIKNVGIMEGVTVRASRLTDLAIERIASDAGTINGYRGTIVIPGTRNVVEDGLRKFALASQASNLYQMVLLTRYQRPNVTLVGDAVEMIKNDPAMEEFTEKAQLELSTGKTSYRGVVEFGGKRNSFGSLKYFFISTPVGVIANQKTIKVASNSLTWMIRHATITATPTYNNGVMGIQYHLYDRLDLSGTPGRSVGYNFISDVLGGFYHGLMRNSAPEVYANW